MANERETIRKALDARLSPLSASPRRRERIRTAARKEPNPSFRKKGGFVLAIALLLALAGAALAVGTNLFARFAQNDRRYEGVLDQVTDVTERPASVLDEKLGMVSARVDSAYYDGQTLTLTIAVENARRISEWTPAEEEKALLKPEDGARPATPQTAMTEEEKRIMADAQAAKAAGRPFGIRKDTIWVHDHFYTEDGISLPPYYGEDEEENGTLYEIREFSPCRRTFLAGKPCPSMQNWAEARNTIISTGRKRTGAARCSGTAWGGSQPRCRRPRRRSFPSREKAR